MRMTSISSTLQSALLSAVQSGGIKPVDTAPLKTAISDIASQVTGSPNITAASMKTKVNGLIDQETVAGKLTNDQATELKSLYSKATESEGGIEGFVSQLTSAAGAGGLYGAKGSTLHTIGSLLVHALV
jgi:hypothetical protein